MKRLLQLSLVAVAVLTLASCGKERYSSGPYITEYRTVDADYQELDIDGAMSVEIAQDVDYDVKIETGERRMEYIHTDVIGNTLRIYEENNRVIKDKAVRVIINKTYLERLVLSGSGDVWGSGIEANDMEVKLDGSGDIDLSFQNLDEIEVELEGSGDIRLDGSALIAEVELDGSGDIHMKPLTVQDAEVHLDGSGDIEVTVTENLNAVLDGSGDIRYWGNPAFVQTSINGSGNINAQ